MFFPRVTEMHALLHSDTQTHTVTQTGPLMGEMEGKYWGRQGKPSLSWAVGVCVCVCVCVHAVVRATCFITLI